MIIKNKLDQSFGPSGTAAGRLIFVVGLVTIYYSNLGLALIILGAFLGFTNTRAWLDFEKKRVKPVEYIFGILPYGNWIYVQPEMKLGISKNVQRFQVFSQSNKSTELIHSNFRIAIYDGGLKKLMDLKKFPNRELAEKELNQYATQLGIELLPHDEMQ